MALILSSFHSLSEQFHFCSSNCEMFLLVLQWYALTSGWYSNRIYIIWEGNIGIYTSPRSGWYRLRAVTLTEGWYINQYCPTHQYIFCLLYQKCHLQPLNMTIKEEIQQNTQVSSLFTTPFLNKVLSFMQWIYRKYPPRIYVTIFFILFQYKVMKQSL